MRQRLAEPLAVERSGLVSRVPGRLLAARTLEDLRGVLALSLQGLQHDHARFALYVRDGRGTLAPVAGRDGDRRGGDEQLLASLSSRVSARRGDLSRLLALPARRELRRGAMMSAPLLDAAEELIGLVVIEGAPHEPDFTRRHAVTLEGIAALLSLAVQRLGVENARAQTRIEMDREAASRLQLGLMSRRLPSDIGVTAHTEYLPAFGVGGDFYSLKHLGDRRVGVAIGDVSGNGVSAALMMSRVASDIERGLEAGDAPSTVLGTLNERLSDSESEAFVTASCIQLDLRSRRLVVANAGHLPLVVRRASGEVLTCGGASGMPLGMVDCDYVDEELVLEANDILVLMTDGLLEAFDHPSGERGLGLLADLVGRSPHDAGDVHARVRTVVDEARRTSALDDTTWIVLQVGA